MKNTAPTNTKDEWETMLLPAVERLLKAITDFFVQKKIESEVRADRIAKGQDNI